MFLVVCGKEGAIPTSVELPPISVVAHHFFVLLNYNVSCIFSLLMSFPLPLNLKSPEEMHFTQSAKCSSTDIPENNNENEKKNLLLPNVY